DVEQVRIFSECQLVASVRIDGTELANHRTTGGIFGNSSIIERNARRRPIDQIRKFACPIREFVKFNAVVVNISSIEARAAGIGYEQNAQQVLEGVVGMIAGEHQRVSPGATGK